MKRGKGLRRTVGLARGRGLQRTGRSSIRSLRVGETLPLGEPRRYGTIEGYVRLRWKMGPGQYVETYERDVDGRLVRDRPGSQRRIDVEQATALYESGLSLPAVARRLGCDHGALSRALRRAGVSARSKADYHPVDPAEVVRLYLIAGQSAHSVARQLGITPGRALRILRAEQVEVRPVGRPLGPAGLTYETEFQRMRPKVRRRSGGRCEARIEGVCQGQAAHVHHRRPRGRGGDNQEVNLLDTCARCHSWIHAHPRDAQERGYLLPSTR